MTQVHIERDELHIQDDSGNTHYTITYQDGKLVTADNKLQFTQELLEELKRNLTYCEMYGEFLSEGVTGAHALELLKKGAPLWCVDPEDWHNCVFFLRDDKFMYLHEYAHYADDSELSEEVVCSMTYHCVLPNSELLWAMKYEHEIDEDEDE